MQRRSAFRTLTGCALVASTAGLLAACSESRPQFSSIDLTGADYAKDFRLPDQDGKIRSLQDFRGKVVVVFFGYTQCPDVCPTTLTELA
ncbi:MAG: SCO family protein, partial [Ramlibacter sp.]|nr:SCO family protein [Ramlibacter sp.]